MAPVSGSTSFTVEHPGSERYYVVAPWGRIVATFSTAEDGPLAEALAGALADVETATLELAAEHMETGTAEIVMAFEAAYEEIAPGALKPAKSRQLSPPRQHDRHQCRTRVSYTGSIAGRRASNRVQRMGPRGGTR
jgi:hypothetical protein